MYGAPYIFYFVLSIVKTVKMMFQRVDFEQNLKNICPATVVQQDINLQDLSISF